MADSAEQKDYELAPGEGRKGGDAVWVEMHGRRILVAERNPGQFRDSKEGTITQETARQIEEFLNRGSAGLEK